LNQKAARGGLNDVREDEEEAEEVEDEVEDSSWKPYCMNASKIAANIATASGVEKTACTSE
jgi:hypothetical protein